MSHYIPEGGRVVVVMLNTGGGWESQCFEEFQQQEAEDYLVLTLEKAGEGTGTVLGFDFTPYAQDFGEFYDADGGMRPEREREFRLSESRTSTGDLVSDAIESRWNDLVADAITQIASDALAKNGQEGLTWE